MIPDNLHHVTKTRTAEKQAQTLDYTLVKKKCREGNRLALKLHIRRTERTRSAVTVLVTASLIGSKQLQLIVCAKYHLALHACRRVCDRRIAQLPMLNIILHCCIAMAGLSF